MKTNIIIACLILLSMRELHAQNNSENHLDANTPVAMISSDENDLQIEWFTTKEVNASYFLVLRSDNGIDFYIVDRVTASGSYTFKSTYFYSVDLPADVSTATYKIELVDMNGRHYASNQISVEIPEDFASGN